MSKTSRTPTHIHTLHMIHVFDSGSFTSLLHPFRLRLRHIALASLRTQTPSLCSCIDSDSDSLTLLLHRFRLRLLLKPLIFVLQRLNSSRGWLWGGLMSLRLQYVQKYITLNHHHIKMHVCDFLNICDTCIHACKDTCKCKCTYKPTDIHVHTCTHVFMHTSSSKTTSNTCVRMYTCTHAYAHTYVHRCTFDIHTLKCMCIHAYVPLPRRLEKARDPCHLGSV
jgi:hypothetical protein